MKTAGFKEELWRHLQTQTEVWDVSCFLFTILYVELNPQKCLICKLLQSICPEEKNPVITRFLSDTPIGDSCLFLVHDDKKSPWRGLISVLPPPIKVNPNVLTQWPILGKKNPKFVEIAWRRSFFYYTITVPPFTKQAPSEHGWMHSEPWTGPGMTPTSTLQMRKVQSNLFIHLNGMGTQKKRSKKGGGCYRWIEGSDPY